MMAIGLAPSAARGGEGQGRYLDSARPDQVRAWLARQTDIAPDRVVSISSAALLAVTDLRKTSDGPSYSVGLRGEILTPALQAREGFLSWRMTMDADCSRRRIRLGPSTSYRDRNLKGEARLVRPASRAWEEPPQGVGLEAAWRAACDPDFRWPLASGPPASGETPLRASVVAPAAAKGPRPETSKSQGSGKKPSEPGVRPSRPAAATASTASVQVGAAASREGAESLLRRLRSGLAGFPQSLRPRVERAVVHSKVFYRAVLDGFADDRAARAFCERARKARVGCLVRASR